MSILLFRIVVRRAQAIVALSLFLLSAANAAQPGTAAIASAHPLATQAGLDVLAQGGNAFDAAVAVAAALAVVEPSSSGLGGGGFFLLHRAADKFETFIDARETAPAAATRDMFLDAAGQPVRNASRSTALAAGIPGEVAGMAHLSARYGRLPLEHALQPAIRLAEEGFPLYARLRGGLEFSAEALQRSPSASRIFLRKGQVPDEGARIRQPELARTLRLIAAQGADGFYKGKLARQLVAGVRKLGGIWSLEDLSNYRVREREPLRGHYAGASIVAPPPPSAGGVALLNALNILSGYPLERFDSATRKHLVIEALRRVYRDRAEYLGDPDFVAVPVAQLTSPLYAAGQRASIRLDRATPSEALPANGAIAPEHPQTTHFSVLDAEGNRVAATLTVNLGFGSGLMVEGTGFFLNNEMDDFSIKPGVPNAFRLVGAEANAIAPGKRMLSSMTPTFVETDDGVLIIGSPGGSYIISMVLLGTLEWLDGHTAEEVVALRRYHHQYLPDMVTYESSALSDEEIKSLQQRGHRLSESPRSYGNMQVVTWNKKIGEVKAASDPRGKSVGQQY